MTARIDVDLNVKCPLCGKPGATQGGKGMCLNCVVKKISPKGGRMGKRSILPDETDQGVLVPMSEDELKKASKDLARKVRRLDEMEAEHADMRKQMKEDRDKLREEISGIASTIRTQGK